MNLDVNTLFLVTIYVEAILGLLLLFAWVQNTSITAVAWWGFAHLLQAASVTLFGLYGSVSDLISIDLANVPALYRVWIYLDRCAGIRPPQAAAGSAIRRCDPLAGGEPSCCLQQFVRTARVAQFRHYRGLHLGHGLRILARTRRDVKHYKRRKRWLA